MQEHFYALYVFTVVMVEWQPLTLNSSSKIYSTPGEGPIRPVFASKWPQRMPGQLLKIILRKIERFRVSGKKDWAPPSLDEG